MKHTAPPARPTRNHEDDAEVVGQLSIRFMERVIEGVLANPVLAPNYNAIFRLLADVAQDELKDYAFDFAYLLFSDEDIVRSQRRAFEEEATGSEQTNEDFPQGQEKGGAARRPLESL